MSKLRRGMVSIVAVLSCIPSTMADMPALKGGLWQIRHWNQSDRGAERARIVSSEQCIGTGSLIEAPGPDLSSVSAGSWLQRVTVVEGQTVVDSLSVTSLRFNVRSPWAVFDLSHDRIDTRHVAVEKNGLYGVGFKRSASTRRFSAREATSDAPATTVSRLEGHRLRGCLPEFQFMTLRELWRSIFQRGL